MAYRFNKIFAKDRRTFLKQMAGAGLSLAFVGCGKGNPGGGGGGGGGEPVGESSLTTAPPASVSSTVDAKQIGGDGLKVITTYSESSAVTDGAFQTQASSGFAQVVFVRDAAAQVRGMALSIPSAGVPVLPTIDATSTAVVLVFLTPGIVVVDAAEAKFRMERIQAAAAFPALVAALAERLPTMPVPTAAAEVQSQLEAAITEVHSGLMSVRSKVVMFRTPEEQAEIDRSGGIYFVEDRTHPNVNETKLTIHNEGWRFVELRRQNLSATSKELSVDPARMTGTFFPGSPSVLQGINGFSIGNLFTGQIGEAGKAVDVASHASDTSRFVYWAYGWGNPFHPNNTPLPPSVQLPNTEGGFADKCTLFMYLVLPILEPVLAVSGLAKMTFAEADKALGLIGLTINFANLRAALNTGDAGNIKSAMIDLAKVAVVAAGGALATYLAGTALGFSATAATTLIEVVGIVGSAANLIAAVSYYLRTPQIADIEHKVLGPASLERLGTRYGIQVLDVSSHGSMVYNIPDSETVTGGCFFKKYSSSPVRLLNVAGEAQVNDRDYVFYQDQSHALNAELRGPDGQTVTIRTPAFGLQANGVVALSPEGHVYAMYTPDAQPEIYTYTAEGYQSFGPTAYQLRGIGSGRSGVGRAGKSQLVSNFYSPDSSVKGVVGTYTVGGAWFYDVKRRGNAFETYQAIDMNSKNETLLFETEVAGDSFVGWSFTFTLSIQGAGGKRTVFRESDGPPDGDGGTPWRVRASAVGLNDDGEVAGHYTYTNNLDGRSEDKAVLWTGGQMKDIASLLPAGAPAGKWRAVMIKGRFIVLEHSSPESGTEDVYLFYRGRG